MAYEKKSIRAIIDDVNSRRVYLPAIQRKYVWGDSQITRLMDSIMLEYHITTIIFIFGGNHMAVLENCEPKRVFNV